LPDFLTFFHFLTFFPFLPFLGFGLGDSGSLRGLINYYLSNLALALITFLLSSLSFIIFYL